MTLLTVMCRGSEQKTNEEKEKNPWLVSRRDAARRVGAMFKLAQFA